MWRELLGGFDLREYSSEVQRFFLFAILLFSSLALFNLLYNLYLLRLGFHEAYIGRLVGLFPLASGLCAIPTGLFSDRVGRRPFLMAACLVLGLSQLGLCTVTHPAALLGLSFLGGVAMGFVFVNFIPFLAERAGVEHRGQAIAIWLSIQLVTRMLVSLGGGYLPGVLATALGLSTDQPEPFRYALLFGAALAVAAIVPLVGARSPALGGTAAVPPEPGQRPRTPWTSVLLLGSISACRGLSWGLFFPFVNVFLQTRFGASPAEIGMVFFASMALNLPGTVAAPAVGRRLGPAWAIVPVRLVGAACLATMGGPSSLPLVVVLFVAAMALDALAVPVEMTFATNSLSRPHWARMQSLRVTGFQILSGAGSLAAGSLIQACGYWLPFALAGAGQVASIFFLLAAIRRERAQPVA